MNAWLNALGRALLDCLRPKIIAISLLPLAVMLALVLLLGYFYWTPAVQAFGQWLQTSMAWGWIQPGLAQLGMDNAATWVASTFVFLVSSSLVAILSLVLVAVFMMPAMVQQVAARRFPQLASLGEQGWVRSLWWGLWATVLAVAAWVLTLPLWLIPPLAFVIPPLIWGWLAYRLFASDALLGHANAQERQLLLQQHRWPLLLMGVVCAYLGAAPSVVWASGIVFVLAFPVLLPLGVWIYTLVFIFSALWFIHYMFHALHELRLSQGYGLVDVVEDLKAEARPTRSTGAAVAEASIGSLLPKHDTDAKNPAQSPDSTASDRSLP